MQRNWSRGLVVVGSQTGPHQIVWTMVWDEELEAQILAAMFELGMSQQVSNDFTISKHPKKWDRWKLMMVMTIHNLFSRVVSLIYIWIQHHNELPFNRSGAALAGLPFEVSSVPKEVQRLIRYCYKVPCQPFHEWSMPGNNIALMRMWPLTSSWLHAKLAQDGPSWG